MRGEMPCLSFWIWWSPVPWFILCSWTDSTVSRCHIFCPSHCWWKSRLEKQVVSWNLKFSLQKSLLLNRRPSIGVLGLFLGSCLSGISTHDLLVWGLVPATSFFVFFSGSLHTPQMRDWLFHFVPLWFLWVAFSKKFIFFSWQSCVSCVSIFHY